MSDDIAHARRELFLAFDAGELSQRTFEAADEALSAQQTSGAVPAGDTQSVASRPHHGTLTITGDEAAEFCAADTEPRAQDSTVARRIGAPTGHVRVEGYVLRPQRDAPLEVEVDYVVGSEVEP